MFSPIKISIIIVNYCTADLIVNCVRSIESHPDESISVNVVIVDNCSNDDSVEILKRNIHENGWDTWVSIIKAEKNGGYSYGNNLGVEYLIADDRLPEFIWLLNPDTVIREGACRELVYQLMSDTGIGIVGSRLEDPDSTPQISVFRYHSAFNEFLSGISLNLFSKVFSKKLVPITPISNIPHQADWVAGASMMIKRGVLKDVGMFDEDYFLYFEEVDFCLQAARNGWECWYVPASRVVHLVGAATGISDSRRKAPRRPIYWFNSRRRYFLKNYGKITLLFADILWIIGFSLKRPIDIVRRKKNLSIPPSLFKDFIRNSVLFRGFRI